jgi:hypothetical protein
MSSRARRSLRGAGRARPHPSGRRFIPLPPSPRRSRRPARSRRLPQSPSRKRDPAGREPRPRSDSAPAAFARQILSVWKYLEIDFWPDRAKSAACRQKEARAGVWAGPRAGVWARRRRAPEPYRPKPFRRGNIWKSISRPIEGNQSVVGKRKPARGSGPAPRAGRRPEPHRGKPVRCGIIWKFISRPIEGNQRVEGKRKPARGLWARRRLPPDRADRGGGRRRGDGGVGHPGLLWRGE